MKKRFIYIALIFLFITRCVFSDNYGFFVDGGYSPGPNDTELDKMVDKRVDDAKKNMEDKDPKAKTKRIDKKDDLLKALEEVNCKCGDEITLYMVGHGNKGEFCFTKEGKKLKAEDLRKALTKAAKECCCKIHVVIFACHSGSFIEELFKEDHVMDVHTSCSADEESHSDAYDEDGHFFDGGDWADGFNEDYKKSTKQNEGDRIQEASESAKEKVPYPPDKKIETPQGWRRGEYEIYGHVSKIRKDKTGKKIEKITVHIYQPEFLRCKGKEIDVGDVNVPDGVVPCKWITVKANFNKPTDSLKASSDVAIKDPPTEKVLAHVEERIGKDKVKIHIISPKWLYCNVVTIKVEKPGKIDDNVQPCRWVNVDVLIKNQDNKDTGFATGGDVKAHDQEFKCKVHIEKVSWQTGKMTIHILEPQFLNCQTLEVIVPDGEREKLRKLDKCSNISIKINFKADGTITVKDVKVVTDAEGAKKFSLDVSVQKPKPPVIDSSGNYQPFIGVTNTGLNTVSFPVYAVICKLSEKYLIENWWRTGEGEPTVGWHDMKNVGGLPFAETRIVNFNIWHAPQGSETYWLGFRTKLSGDENPASDTASIIFTVTQQAENHAPVLLNAHSAPDSGTITTSFTYSVTYRDEDNDAPSVHQVLIDNSPFNMTGSGNYTEGVVFNYQITLSLGAHTYSFRFDDGHGHQVNSAVYSGPMVTGGTMNHAPILQEGSVMPDSGNYYTPFVYRVLYIDQDNDAPTVYQAYIDNTPFNMTPQGNHFNEGVFFILQRNLNPGNHTFYFRFDDGHGHMVTSQTYTGPIVH